MEKKTCQIIILNKRFWSTCYSNCFNLSIFRTMTLITILLICIELVTAQSYTLRDCTAGFDNLYKCSTNLNGTTLPQIPRSLLAIKLRLTISNHNLATLPPHIYPGYEFRVLSFEEDAIEIISNNSFEKIGFLNELIVVLIRFLKS